MSTTIRWDTTLDTPPPEGEDPTTWPHKLRALIKGACATELIDVEDELDDLDFDDQGDEDDNQAVTAHLEAKSDKIYQRLKDLEDVSMYRLHPK